jgi:NAD(P)-dependent dehydrogenase (short-subunit alcohol dehydrogenase family)
MQSSMQPNLDGKVAIVTGAGRGIGRAEAIALAALGARVVVNDLGCEWDGSGSNVAPVDEVVAEIKASGGDAVANYGDVALWSTGEQAVQQALDEFGRLDILVNNAGILRPKAFVDLSEADWDVLIAVHLKGHFTLTRAATKVFIAQGYGRIINTSSDAGLGMPLFANYGAAKEGITGLTRTLAFELAPHNVTVNQIRPRTSTTRMFDVAVKAGEQMGAALTETLPGATEQGLFANPEAFGAEHVASLVAFLAGDAASGITNGDFQVGGGEVSVLSHPVPLTTFRWGVADFLEQLHAATGNPERIS